MLILIYILLALFATLTGSMTGVGGGVIMKPLMDLLGDYDAATIGILSSVTLLSMSIVSCILQFKNRSGVKLLQLVLLGLGSVGGGLAGQALFGLATANLASDSVVKIVQNAILCALIAVIFVFMLNKDKVKSLALKHWIFYVAAGLGLGMLSSFLGIGGGPINVAILILLFSMDMKTAGFSSIFIIFFAQLSKLTTVAASTGFSGFDLTVLPYMAAAAVVGALVGSFIKKRVNDKVIVVCFNGLQLIIVAMCVVNIVKLAI